MACVRALREQHVHQPRYTIHHRQHGRRVHRVLRCAGGARGKSARQGLAVHVVPARIRGGWDEPATHGSGVLSPACLAVEREREFEFEFDAGRELVRDGARWCRETRARGRRVRGSRFVLRGLAGWGWGLRERRPSPN